MNVIEKTRNDIKAYVKSLNTPENTIYQENKLLILSCFAKAQEILEENEKLALIIPDVIPTLFCGANVKTCVYYDKGKCKHDEFECRDQVTK